MKQPDPKTWSKVLELFDTLVELDPETQAKTLATVEDKQVKAWLQKLLAADARENILLDKSMETFAGALFEQLADDSAGFEIAELIGRTFGAYRIVKELGRGGMSVVMMADRADGRFEKQVALKLIKPGPFTAITSERLSEETRILARMQHPNIAHLLDAGVSEDGIAWTAMEYCEGLSLTRYCDEHRLSINARLGLLKTICSAVHYAHKNLVIHRDLKPSNILVENDGTVKLLDFGISSILNEPDDAGSLTQFYTPVYAAPEQFTGKNISTATDLYALGVIAYQLLCGQLPFTSSGGHNQQRLEALKEAKLAETFDLPSTALTKINSDQPEQAKEIARTRAHQRPAKLAKKLSGDLDAMITRSMRADSSERYASAQELSQDIQNHLDNLPVSARPTSARYRSGRFIARHAWGVAAVCVIAVALIAGLSAALWQADIARTETKRAETVQDFLVEMFATADPFVNKERPISVDTLVSNQTERIEASFSEQPEILLTLQQLLASIQSSLGNYDQAIEIYQNILTKRQQDGASDALLAESYSDIAQQQQLQANDLDLALATVEKATALAPMGQSDVMTSLQVALVKAAVLDELGRVEEVAELTNSMLTYADQIPNSEAGNKMLGSIYINASIDHGNIGKTEEALILNSKGLELYEQFYGSSQPQLADAYSARGSIFLTSGEYKEGVQAIYKAMTINQAVFGPMHTKTLRSEEWLAIGLGRMGCLTQGITVYEHVVERFSEIHGQQHRTPIRALQNLTGMKRAAFMYESGLSDIDRVLDFYQQQPGDSAWLDGGYAIALSTKGYLQYDLGNKDQGVQTVLEAMNLLRDAIGEEHKYYFQIQLGYLNLLLGIDNDAKTISYALEVYNTLNERLGEDSAITGRAALMLAAAYQKAGNQSSVEQLITQHALSQDAIDAVLTPPAKPSLEAPNTCELPPGVILESI